MLKRFEARGAHRRNNLAFCDASGHTERVLHGVGFHPSICHESAGWAYDHYHYRDHIATLTGETA